MIDPNIFHILIPVAHAAEEATKDTGIAATFGVDWMKFIAQLINFAIVLFVLWKFVFTPVTKKLEERTAKIEKAMKDAASTEVEKQEFAKWKEQEMSKVRSQATGIVNEAETQATKAKDEILRKAQEDQQKIVEQAKKQILEEKTAQLQAAKGELADIITNATEKILREKLNGAKDQELIKESLKNI